jgi:RNA polymerase sigma-70 factor (ECF subfamily)
MDRVGLLFEANARRVWNLARSLTRSTEDADDLVQQAFTIALTKRAEIPDEAWPWLAKVVTFCARNHNRHRARRLGMADVHEVEISGNEPDPSEAAARRELANSLHAALNDLAHDEREAVALCHLGGLSQSQACQIVGVELNTLKARVRRGLQHLQVKLGLSEAAVSTFLSGFVFPPPADGWDLSLARWQRNARDGSAAPAPHQPYAALKLFGLAAVATLVGAGVWLTLGMQYAGADAGRGGLAADGKAAGDFRAGPDSVADQSGVKSGTDRGPNTASEKPEDPAGEPAFSKPETEPVKPPPPDPNAPGQAGSLEVRTIYYANKRIEVQWTELVKPGKTVRHGTLTHYWPNGNVMETGEYVDDLREGLWTYRYEDNVKNAEGEFLHNKPHGIWRTFDEKGNPGSKGRYENGQHQGEWVTLHPNGEKAEVKYYVDDLLHGLETEFDEQGRKRRETQWFKNKKHGLETLWNEEGEVTSRKLYIRGK